jgi:hypothetical protein
MKVSKLIMGLGGLIGGLTMLGEALSAGAGLADANPGKQLPTTKKKSDMTVTRHTVRGIDDRLKYIVAKIKQGRLHPNVREFAVKAVSKKCGDTWCTPEKNWEAEVDTMFNVVRGHVRYVRDTYGIDLYQHAKRTLQFGGGDCDDYTITLGALLQAIGYPVKCRVIQTVDSDDWNHIYLLCGLPPRNPTKWKVLDASMDKPAGWECPKRMISKMRDFMVD